MTTDCSNPLLVNSDNATVFENTVILCGPSFDSNQLILRSLPQQDTNIFEIRTKTLDESCLSSGGVVLLAFNPINSNLTISSGSLHSACGYSAGTIVSPNGIYITMDDPNATGVSITAAPNQLGDLLSIKDSGCSPLLRMEPSGNLIIYNDLTVLGNINMSGDNVPNILKFTASGAVPSLTLDSSMDIIEVNFDSISGQVYLPNALAVGDTYDIKNCGTGVFSIEPSGSSTIDGASELTIITKYDSYTLTSDGIDWIII
jgi:hypothetical protein